MWLLQVFGSWVPVLCAYAFFLTGLLLQRLVMLPVASAVYQQEAAEGAFRYAHTRFRAWAAEIAMYRCVLLGGWGLDMEARTGQA